MTSAVAVSSRTKLAVFAAIGALAVVVAGLGVVAATRHASAPANGASVAIAISDTACTPNTTTVAAGTPSFLISNTSARATEWEILDGVMVLAERENILPGAAVEVTPRLAPGVYQMTCGLLSNPRGSLTVTAADGSTSAGGATPRLADLVAPTGEFRVYAITSADQLTTATAALAAAVDANDLPAARAHAGEAIVAFARLAPITHLFAREADALTVGPAALAPLADGLTKGASTAPFVATAADAAKHAATLGGTIHATTAAPREIVLGAGNVVAGIGQGNALPADAAARIAGVRKVVELFRPLTLRADKALSGKLDGDLGAVETALAGSPAPVMAQLKAPLADLGADLTDLLAALGLNVS